MLIKQVTKKGEPVLYTPDETLPFAVERGVSGQNNAAKVFWVVRESIKKDTIHFNQLPENNWEAVATGTADIGYTDVKTDKFHVARGHKFSIQYKTDKDHLGLPDILVVKFETTSVSSNPLATMGF